MKNTHQKIILITGASSGLGEASARFLSKQGHVVFGTSRTLKNAQLPYHLVEMDVTNKSSVQNAIQNIYEQVGKIDVIVNNAGSAIGGAVADTSIEEAQQQLDVNFLGTLRVCQAIIPKMKVQQQGMIINISSIAGLVGMPYQGIYSASKFALEGVSQAMRMELSPYNIKVVLINPGDFKTSITANRSIIKSYLPTPPSQFTRTLDIINRDEQQGNSPEKIARLIGKIIQKRNPKAKYLVGSLPETIFAKLTHILPVKLSDKILADHYKIEKG